VSTSSGIGAAAELIGIQITILVVVYLSSRARRSEADSGANIFRIVPWIAWLIAIACPLISGVYLIAAFVPGYHEQRLFLASSLMFFVTALFGVHWVTLRIHLNEHSLSVSSIFGTRTTLFSDIESIEDRQGKPARILKVKNKRGKLVLYVADWYVADYPFLVDLIKDGAADAKKVHKTAHLGTNADMS
jgi:hypothetical protein